MNTLMAIGAVMLLVGTMTFCLGLCLTGRIVLSIGQFADGFTKRNEAQDGF